MSKQNVKNITIPIIPLLIHIHCDIKFKLLTVFFKIKSEGREGKSLVYNNFFQPPPYKIIILLSKRCAVTRVYHEREGVEGMGEIGMSGRETNE